jgi:hypothetical protein
MDPATLATQLSRQYMTALSETINLNGIPQIIQPYAVWDWGGNSYPMGSVPWQQVAVLDRAERSRAEYAGPRRGWK